eukprot:818218-Alexandrium_andersonii.AAC.1
MGQQKSSCFVRWPGWPFAKLKPQGPDGPVSTRKRKEETKIPNQATKTDERGIAAKHGARPPARGVTTQATRAGRASRASTQQRTKESATA